MYGITQTTLATPLIMFWPIKIKRITGNVFCCLKITDAIASLESRQSDLFSRAKTPYVCAGFDLGSNPVRAVVLA